MKELNTIIDQLKNSEPYLPDQGFTLSVIKQIPADNRIPFWIKNAIILCATILGSAIAAWQLPLTKIVSVLLSSTINLPVLLSTALVIYVFSYWAIQINEKNEF